MPRNPLIYTILVFFILQAPSISSDTQDEEKALQELSDAWALHWQPPVLKNHCSTAELAPLKCNENSTTVTEIRLRGRTFYNPRNPSILGSIKAFKNLLVLDLSITGIRGTIPKEIGELTKLRYLLLSQNANLVYIPPEVGNLSALIEFDASLCNFNSMPKELANLRNLQTLNLEVNQITGTIPQEFGNMTNLRTLKLGFNQFTGSIPSAIPNLPYLQEISLEGNQLTGTLPKQWSQTMTTINLFGNSIDGPIPQVLCGLPQLKQLNLGNNELSGPMTECLSQVTGTLQSLNLRSNHLNGTIPEQAPWSGCMSLNRQLTFIDLSHNQLEGKSPSPKQNCLLKHLDLSHNRLSGNLGEDLHNLQLDFLDLSHNYFTGSMPADLRTRSILHIDLSHNRLSGKFDDFLGWRRVAQYLDISNNLFAFDVSQFGLFTQLTYLNCSNNQMFGTDLFDSISAAPRLQIMDLSHNNLSLPLNIDRWIEKSKKQPIDLIDVSGNPRLPIIKSSSNLQKNPKALALIDGQNFVCAELSIPRIEKFLYDEGLFNWTQCDCRAGYFGTPPACYLCNFTQQGITCDGSRNLSITANWYPIIVERQVQFESCVTIHPSESPCNVPAYLQGDTNGIQVIGNVCQTGSTGRKCSNCICDSTQCYFRRGPECRQCKDIMRKSVFGTLIAAATIVVLVFVIFVFYQTLDLRRRKLVPWSELQLWRRVLYRAKSAARFGMTKILISFVQSVTVLSSWDVYLELTWLKIMNAMNLGRWGIACYFRSLANLSTEFYLHMTIPLIASVVLAFTVGLASLIWHLKHRPKHSDKTYYEIISSEAPKRQKVRQYSAWSLWVSSVISVTMFLYFGLSLSVVANLICEKQPLSGEKYLLAYPWQLCSEIRTLQRMSIVPLVFYVVGIPLVYGIILWCIRKRLTNTKVQDYFYPLYRAYKIQYAWYGLLVTTRMFLLAVVLRVTSEQDPSHAYFVVMILSMSLVVQFIFKPWKGRYENIAERVSLLLCIITFMLRLAPSEENVGTGLGDPVFKWFPLQIVMIVLNCLYMIMLVVVIIWRSVKEPCEYHALYAAILKVDDPLQQQLVKTENFDSSSKLNSESDQLETSEDDGKSFGFFSESENETEDDEI